RTAACRLAAGAAPWQQDLVERRMDCRRGAAPRRGAGWLPQPLWPPGRACDAALSGPWRAPRDQRRLRRGAVVFGAAMAHRLRAPAAATLLAGRSLKLVAFDLPEDGPTLDTLQSGQA